MSLLRPEPRRIAAATLLISLAVFLVGGALWACGPFFPAWILGSDLRVLEAPVLRFEQLLDGLLPKEKPPFQAVVASEEEGLYARTATVDHAELEKALAASSIPAERRAELLAAHDKLRQALAALAEPPMEGETAEEKWPEEEPPAPDLTVPSGLPGEFEDYLRGAVAWHQGKTDEAREHWTRLLDRPADERRFRSTWAAFMLGKAALDDDPAAAVRWFERTRELASQGFADGLGLGAASLGWQARAEWNLGHPEQSLRLYAQQAATGDPTAPQSLRFTSAHILEGSADLAVRAAKDPEARRIVTAYVLSPRWRDSWGDPAESYPEGKAWLDAVTLAGITDVDGADRLAWAAYMGADFDAARQWAERAPEDAPLARWVKAKLLLRDGKLDEAEALLVGVARDLPAADMSPDEASIWLYEKQMPVATGPRALGEAGAVALSRGESVTALDRLLRGGYWLDAAYIAERVLTEDELKDYVDATWSAEVAARYRPPAPDEWAAVPWGGLLTSPPERVAYDLRYLLGRRLVRAGRYEESRAYLPEARREGLDDLASSLARGRDTRRSPAERAADLFHGACVMRHQGMELLGAEIEPDWAFFGGAFEPDPITEERTDRGPLLKATVEEQRRIVRHSQEGVSPWERFHYRFRAADLAREAAALLPDGSEEKVQMLAVAGAWIKLRDPKAALPLYRELLRCCRRTDIGRGALKIHWFPVGVPEIEGCEPPPVS
jgi:hypothetical protein